MTDSEQAALPIVQEIAAVSHDREYPECSVSITLVINGERCEAIVGMRFVVRKWRRGHSDPREWLGRELLGKLLGNVTHASRKLSEEQLELLEPTLAAIETKAATAAITGESNA